MRRFPVYLLCGVPASGKTWVIDQLNIKHIQHDGRDYKDIIEEAKLYTELYPVIIDCPFKERELRTLLENAKLTVRPYFIVENPSTIAIRYYKRGGKPAPKNILTRAETIMDKVREWNAPFGTAQEILDMLSKVR